MIPFVIEDRRTRQKWLAVNYEDNDRYLIASVQTGEFKIIVLSNLDYKFIGVGGELD